MCQKIGASVGTPIGLSGSPQFYGRGRCAVLYSNRITHTWSPASCAVPVLMLMPWQCPACSTRIRHSENEAFPPAGVIYRCPVCRLELMLGGDLQTFVVAPLRGDQRNGKADRRKAGRSGRRETDHNEPSWVPAATGKAKQKS